MAAFYILPKRAKSCTLLYPFIAVKCKERVILQVVHTAKLFCLV